MGIPAVPEPGDGSPRPADPSALARSRVRADIPIRPDHGHLLADDIAKRTNPGYSYIGRLKGLAELRGVMRALDARRSA